MFRPSCSKAVTASFFVVLCMLAMPVHATEVSGAHKQNDFCAAGSMNVCGVPFLLAPSSLGSVLSLRLPEQFERQTFMVQCASRRGGTYYVLVNDGQHLCEQKQCKAGPVTACDTQIPVPRDMQIGDTTTVTVPPSLLAPSKKTVASSFDVKCVIERGTPQFEVVNTAGVSCTNFPCEPATLSICQDYVRIEEASEHGRVLQLSTQKKYPVTVQCLSSGGQRPAYKIVDSSRVICE